LSSNTASGEQSIALGNGTTAIGQYSMAMGTITTASGYLSTAMGNATYATGSGAMAMGVSSRASGYASTAMGASTLSSGDNSTAMGNGTISKSLSSLALGRYNDTIASSNPTEWVATDPLLYIGNGQYIISSSSTIRSNAMVVYKNANVDINGYTRLGTQASDAPAIKMKELTTTSAATINGQVPITHGLTVSKIISVTVLLEWTTGFFAPPEYSPDLTLRYNYFVTPTQIIIQNNATGGTNVINKPVKILVTYKE
jgi:hypothetical protein